MTRFLYTLFFVMLLAHPAYGATLTDDVGNTITFDKPYTRIISLYAAHTENLFELGLEKEVIGVSNTEDYPSHALEKPAFNARDGVEKFLKAQPDLVLIRPMHWRGYPGLWAALKKHGITVIALQPNTIPQMYDYWRNLGRLSGRELDAERMVEQFKEGLDLAQQRLIQFPKADRPGVFFESIHRKLSTFAPGSMPIFVMEMAGGKNVARKARPKNGSNIASFGLERLLAQSDKIDVYLAQFGPMNNVEIKTIMTSPAASRIKAVRDRNVFLVDEHLVSRPTMRLLVGIHVIHKLLHPQGNH